MRALMRKTEQFISLTRVRPGAAAISYATHQLAGGTVSIESSAC
jgi:hypothetical protein